MVTDQASRCVWWWEPHALACDRASDWMALYCFIGPEASIAAQVLAPRVILPLTIHEGLITSFLTGRGAVGIETFV